MSKKRLIVYYTLSILLFCSFFILLSFLLTPLFSRFWKALYDLGFSLAYFVKMICNADWEINPGVNDSVYISGFSFSFLPTNAEQFWQEIRLYWSNIFSKPFWGLYWSHLNPFLQVFFRVILILLPILIILYLLLMAFFGFHDPNPGYETKGYKMYNSRKAFYRTVKNEIVLFFRFYFSKKYFKVLTILTVLFFTNVLTILISFVAWYFYFFASFDFGSIWTQIVRFFTDISYMFSLPWIPLWIFGIYYVIKSLLIKRSESKINKVISKNEDFICTYCQISTLIVSNMGKGKTKLLTDLGISTENIFRYKALDKMHRFSKLFPRFDFRLYETYLEDLLSSHKIYNLSTIKQFLNQHILFESSENEDDFVIYNEAFFDGCKELELKTCLIDYAQLYFIYSCKKSFIYSNYGVRSGQFIDSEDHLISFFDDFRISSKELYDNSKFSNIVDFNNIRSYRRIQNRIEYSDAADFGVRLFDEVGKERLNKVELEDVQKGSDDVNQKNDGFNKTIKMARHMATVDNYPFVKFFMTEQRLMSVPADLRELNDAIFDIKEVEVKNLYPFYNFFNWLISIPEYFLTNLFNKYRFNRDENSYLFQLIKDQLSIFTRWRVKKENNFNVELYKMKQITADGVEVDDVKYFLLESKVYSNRYCTDAFSDVFEQKGIKSKYGIYDLPSYKNHRASVDELKLQNSFFVLDLYGRQEKKKSSKAVKSGSKVVNNYKSNKKQKIIFKEVK